MMVFTGLFAAVIAVCITNVSTQDEIEDSVIFPPIHAE